MSRENLDKVVSSIRKHRSFVLSGHIHPEGDCAGSLLALERLLRKLGKKTKIYCHSPFPKSLSFLDRGSWETAGTERPSIDAEAAIALDTPNWDRLGKAVRAFEGKYVINIDHHISNVRFGQVNFIDDKASACGEMIYELYQKFGALLDREDARMLYTAISTDTGSFRYSNTTVRTHEIIAKLLATGFDVEKINQEIYGNYHDSRLSLITEMLERRRMAFGGRLAYSILPHQVLRKTKGSPEDLEGVIDFLRGLKGVKACFLITEWMKGVAKISFRSSSEVDVNQIAAALGGGGHRKASGASSKCSLKQAERLVLDLFKPILS